MIDNCNAFLRITSLLLKVSYSAKNLKKIKMEDFTKLLTVIIQEYSQHITNVLYGLFRPWRRRRTWRK